MKTLEERLREQFRRCAQAGFDTDVDEAQAAEDDGVAIVLDALAILVADAPRIYRGGEIKGAPDGWYVEFDEKQGMRCYYFFGASDQRFIMSAYADRWAFGPLPTNSPSEGKG